MDYTAFSDLEGSFEPVDIPTGQLSQCDFAQKTIAEQGLRKTYWRITFWRVRYGFCQGSLVCLVVVDGNQILASYSFVLWIAYMVSWWTDLTSETDSLDHEKRCWAVRSESARPSRQLSSTYPETRSSIPKSATFQEMSRPT